MCYDKGDFFTKITVLSDNVYKISIDFVCYLCYHIVERRQKKKGRRKIEKNNKADIVTYDSVSYRIMCGQRYK